MAQRILLGVMAMALILLGGCHAYQWSGSVTISFASDAYPVEDTQLVISGFVVEHGNADVDAVAWSVVSAPPGALVVLSDPYAADTYATFTVAGVYVLRFEVGYWVGSDRYRDEAYYRIDVAYPAYAIAAPNAGAADGRTAGNAAGDLSSRWCGNDGFARDFAVVPSRVAADAERSLNQSSVVSRSQG
jgi:hypothetical protein